MKAISGTKGRVFQMCKTVSKRMMRLWSVIVLSGVLMAALLPVRVGMASNARSIIDDYAIRLYDQDEAWHKPMKALVWSQDAHSSHDGILHFMPLEKFVKNHEIPELTIAEGFRFEVESADTLTTIRCAYKIFDEAWEVVAHSETEMPDLSLMEPGRYLLSISVYLGDPDASASMLNLAWLIWNPSNPDDPDTGA